MSANLVWSSHSFLNHEIQILNHNTRIPLPQASKSLHIELHSIHAYFLGWVNTLKTKSTKGCLKLGQAGCEIYTSSDNLH